MDKVTKISVAAAVTLAAFGATQAQAQQRYNENRYIPSRTAYEVDANGNRLDSKTAAFYATPGEQSRHFDLARAFASCAADLSEDRTRLLLDQAVPAKKPGRLKESDYFTRLRGCATSVGGVDGNFLKGALAERLVLKTVPAEGLTAATSGDQVTKFVRGVAVDDNSTENPVTVIQMTSECRVALAPQRARAVLETEPETEAEAVKITALELATPQCDMFEEPEGTTNFFKRTYIARSLYYWSDFESWAGND